MNILACHHTLSGKCFGRPVTFRALAGTQISNILKNVKAVLLQPFSGMFLLNYFTYFINDNLN